MKISPKVRPLFFWSQKVLPLVYDDSLSYYEVLCKVTSKINELIGYITNNIEQLIIPIIERLGMGVSYDSTTETIKLFVTEDEDE